jgi:DNA primase
MEAFLTDLVDQCHRNLDIEDEDPFGGYAYMRGRGVTDEQIKLFRLGIGPSKVWAPHDLKDTRDGKLFNRQFRGSMEGQLVFPLYNPMGTLRGIETRLWEETEKRKYTQYFMESWREDCVFLGMPQALPSIWETKTVYLVEGMFDFFVVQRVFPNTLCTLSAKVMATQYRFLQRWCRHVVFIFDSDEKGREVTQKALERYNVDTRDGFMAHDLRIPTKDPCSLYESWGFDRFKRHLQTQSDRLGLYL